MQARDLRGLNVRWPATILLCGLLLWVASANPPASKIKITRLPTINDIYALAAFDLKTIHPHQRPYIRYIVIPRADKQDMRACSLTVNEISRGTGIYRPDLIGRDMLMLARIDLQKYAPKDQDLQDWFRHWEELQYDPAFSLIITKANLEFAIGSLPDWKGKGFVVKTERTLTDVPAYVQDGKTYTQKYVEHRVGKYQTVVLADLKNINLVRLPDETVNPELLQELMVMTGSLAPVVTLDYFVARTCATIQDKGLFKDIYGGLYFEFAGIPKNSKKGTDLDNLFEQLGIGSVGQGVTFKNIFDKFRSDQRAAKAQSLVTGSGRAGIFVPTLARKPRRGPPIASFTFDLKNRSIDIDTDPLANLIDFKQDGTEGIWDRANDLHGFGQWDGDGKLVEEVPFDIASDAMIPSPHTKRLQSSVCCKRCHETEGSRGWKYFKNDVMSLVGPGGLDIFGDTSKRYRSRADVFDRLVGLYKCEPEEVLGPARDAYSAAVLEATGPWPEAASTAQADVVRYASGHVVRIWERYRYDLVTPRTALRELYLDVSDDDLAQKMFTELMAPDIRSAVPVPETGQVIVPESPTIGCLRVGLPVTRASWDLVRGFARGRAQHRLMTVMAKYNKNLNN